MQKVLLNKSKKFSVLSGFSLVEVILAIALVGLIVAVVAGSLSYAVQSAGVSGMRNKAVLLAEEGVEAVKSIRDRDFESISDGTYGLDNSSGVWEFSGSSDTTDDVFERFVTVSTVDSNTKDVSVEVEWASGVGSTKVETLSSRITTWRDPVSGGWDNPIIAETVDLPNSVDTVDIGFVDETAFLLRESGNDDLRSMDVSDPPDVKEISHINMYGTNSSLLINENFAYVGGTRWSVDIQVVDISDPSAMSFTGYYFSSWFEGVESMSIQKDTLYFGRSESRWANEFEVVDVSNQYSPVGVGSLNIDGSLTSLVSIPGYVFCGTDDRRAELIVIDVSNPSRPEIAAYEDLAGNGNREVLSTAYSNNYVYVGREGGNVDVVSVSNPRNPVALGNINVGRDVNDICIFPDENLLFLATETKGKELTILDVSNPNNPSVISTLGLPVRPLSVEYNQSNEHLYLTTGSNSNEIIVVSKS